MRLVIGNKYKWKHDAKQMIFIGKYGYWNQFSLDGSQKVWCEVLDSDLHLMEEVESLKEEF
jgi:hypothetical protein